MDKVQSAKYSSALCIVGLPDNCEVRVAGYSDTGKLNHVWDGNSDFHNQLDASRIKKTYVPVVWFNDPARSLKKPDIIINNINDADIAGKSLARAAKMVADIKGKWPDVKLFNPPERIFDTARDRIWQLYKDLPGIYIPKAIKITPNGVADVIAQAKEQVGFPFLIRPAGAHQSQGLQLVRSEDDAKLLEIYAYDNQNFYLTEFVDYRSDDGFYRKCRLVIIGGKILPRHYMTGPEWLVHGNLHEEFMANNPKAKHDEENFINNYTEIIKPEPLAALMEIYKRSGLDYLGFDFTIRPDGELLIFEINPAQNSFLKLDFEVFPYMKRTRDDLIMALNDCIISKI